MTFFSFWYWTGEEVKSTLYEEKTPPPLVSRWYEERPIPPFTRVQVNGAWCAGSLYRLSSSPQCGQCGTMYGHNATIVNSHCRLPLCRDRRATGNDCQATPPPPDESDFQLTKHFWGCFRPGLKIETNESRKQLQCLVDTHEAIHLCCQWCSRETLR